MKITCAILILFAATTLVPRRSFADERVLGSANLPFDGHVTAELSEATVLDGAGKLSIQLSAEKKPSSQALPLKSASLAKSKGLRTDSPLQAFNLPLPSGGQACWLTFAIEDDGGGTRAVAALLVQNDNGWNIAKEWVADSIPQGEMGFKREKQTFSSPKPGTLQRQLHNLSVEGVLHKLDCGCTACQSRTIETSEDESYVWNASSGTLDRTLYEKRYIVQIGEGLMSVARKALGDARLLARIYRLNPDLKQEGILKEGQGILVERRTQ